MSAGKRRPKRSLEMNGRWEASGSELAGSRHGQLGVAEATSECALHEVQGYIRCGDGERASGIPHGDAPLAAATSAGPLRRGWAGTKQIHQRTWNAQLPLVESGRTLIHWKCGNSRDN